MKLLASSSLRHDIKYLFFFSQMKVDVDGAVYHIMVNKWLGDDALYTFQADLGKILCHCYALILHRLVRSVAKK